MPNINQNPRGLLELLNLNLQGEYPRLLAGSVSSVIETKNFYLAGIGSTLIADTATLLAVNTAVTIQVPAGEVWAVRAVGCRIQNLEVAAASISASIRILTPALTVGPCMVGGVLQAVLASASYEIGNAWPDPILIEPGFAISGWLNQVSGIPANGQSLTISALVHRLTLA